MKKILAAALALVMVLGTLPAFAYGNPNPDKYDNSGDYFKTDPYYGVSWFDYKEKKGIPLELPYVNKDGFFFNKELFDDLGVTVYGDYKDVADNELKPGSIIFGPDGETRLGEDFKSGYYENSAGEYRYHGYDAQGNRYANRNFRLDADSGTRPEQKHWIYRIWDRECVYRNYYSGKLKGTARIKKASDYNKAATEKLGIGDETYDSQIKLTRQWINDTLPFEIKRGTNSDKSPYNYAHVQTRPTTYRTGEALMFHDPTPEIRTGQNTGLWYQVFSLEKVANKSYIPHKGFIEVVQGDDVITEAEMAKKANITFDVKLSGVLNDVHLWDNKKGAEFSDDVLRGVYYNREDIKQWNFELKDSITEKTLKQQGKRTAPNMGGTVFEVVMTYDDYSKYITEEDRELNPVFNGIVEIEYYNGVKKRVPVSTDANVNAPKEPQMVVDEPEYMPPNLDPLILDISAPNEMLDTERFGVTDNTVLYDGFTREVYLKGEKLSEADADAFLSGDYLFPLEGRHIIYDYKVIYTANYENHDPIVIDYYNYVYVYSTKPETFVKPDGTFKENRTIKFKEASSELHPQYVLDRASVDTVYFDTVNVSGDNSAIKFAAKTDKLQTFIVKEPAEIASKLKVKMNVRPELIQRSDIPADYHEDEAEYHRYVLADITPDIVANIWNWTLPRNEALEFIYEPASLDEDILSVSTYKIYIDEDEDGIPEKLLEEGNYEDYKSYVPPKLGAYKIVFYVEEAFGQPTLEQFITEEDKRTATVERPFYVANLAPMTRLYTDIEIEFPKVDVTMLTDELIERTFNDSLVEKRVDWMNTFRQTGLHANVYHWDLHTYVYEKYVEKEITKKNQQTPLESEFTVEGYSGVIPRVNQVMNEDRWTREWTEYIPRTHTKTVSEGGGVNSSSATYKSDGKRWWLESGFSFTEMPGSMSYSSGGYEGTLTKKSSLSWDDGSPSGSGSPGDYYTRTKGYDYWYEGSVTRNWTDTINHSEVVTDYYYTGTYKGTLYKYVKQAYAGNFRMDSDKYIVYFADDKLNNRADIDAVMARGKSKVILVGKPALKTAYPGHQYFVDGSKPVDEILGEITDIIAEENAFLNAQLLLVGEPFKLMHTDFDDEKDPIDVYGFKYVHEAAYYDNPMGQEPGTGKDAETAPFTDAVKKSFSKTGKYTVMRQIKDTPEEQPEYTKDSNLEKMFIYVHRKPIAKFELDWVYDSTKQHYKTTWVDLSYDRDHEHSDTQKGIRDRRIRYRKTDGDNQWIYSIPDELAAGSYEVIYIVKDIEGVWSDEARMTFTLQNEPPMRLWAKLRSDFPLSGVPASEAVTVYDMVTRYHRGHQVSLTLMNSRNEKVRDMALFLDNGMTKYNIRGDKYNWIPFEEHLSPVLPDGPYSVKVTAKSKAAPYVSETVILPFTVNTPVFVEGTVPVLTTGDPGVLKARTGQYSSATSVVCFKGTPYERRYPMTLESVLPSGDQVWRVEVTPTPSMPADLYTYVFTTETPSGKTAQDVVYERVEQLKITSFDVSGYWNHWRGQKDMFGKQMSVEPHRFLSLEKVVFTAEVIGNPDRVTLRLSSPLESMHYINPQGQRYAYEEMVGYRVDFPLEMTHEGEGRYKATVILPLADHTVSWEDRRAGAPYYAVVYAEKGAIKKEARIEDIDITGNIYDQVYVQPKTEE